MRDDFILSSFEEQKNLKDFSTFGIGGPARYFKEIASIEEMSAVLAWCGQRRLPYFILGKGSNCLFDSRGFNGLVLLNKIDFFEDRGNGQFYVGAGYSFSLLGTQTARRGWSGLEFASGIPGSVGGAVYMNAGANGKETAQSLHQVYWLDEKGLLHCDRREELNFGYRHSPFQGMKGAIVAASFVLQPSETARKEQIAIIQYRTKTQPYGDSSAGCVFRNPENGSAGGVIDQLGLKGLSIGGAMVSEKHANFIVNSDGDATSSDVLELIAKIKSIVKEKKGMDLCEEIRVIPYQMEEKDGGL